MVIAILLPFIVNKTENLHLRASGDALKLDMSAGCRSASSVANLYFSLLPDKSQRKSLNLRKAFE